MRGKILLLVLFIGCLAMPSFAGDMNLIYFSNETSKTIEYIFLSPGDTEYWGPEILGSERILEQGDSIGFYILYPNECDDFDIMAIGDDGGTFVIWDYEICDYAEGAIKIRDANLDEDAPEMDFVEIYIGNDTVPIHFIFISPSDSEMWGVDYLDKDTILDMDGSVGFLFPANDEPIEYNLLGVDEDGDTYQFSFYVDSDSDELTFSIEISDLQ